MSSGRGKAAGAPRATLLSIGSEILLGEIVDTNAAYLAAELAQLGVDLRRVEQVPDHLHAISAAFEAGLAAGDLVLATGGLGPTHDDLTRDGLARALGETLTQDADLAAELTTRFGGMGRMPVSNLRQAMLIPSAMPIPNPIGSAPGWWVDLDRHVLALMPGVPSEMRQMWTDQVVPRLRRRFHLTSLLFRTVKTFGLGESAVAERAGDLLTAPDDGLQAGIYARDDGVHLRFSSWQDRSRLDAAVDRARRLLGDDVYGTDDETLPAVALAALGRAGARSLSTVEHGTDGALLAILSGHTAQDGQARFAGGVLSMSEEDDGIPRAADAVLTVHLSSAAALGYSRVSVALSAPNGGFDDRRLRIHGSGPQRLRRAAFAALDQVRRIDGAAR
jgi:nicotinamide-nucleotide amidase